ncbi:MAG: sulfatase-like hydrolase/transferase [Verrucomicrobia bacterium]|nr:sulfatase-like hydrolase/transferase [Verrucomicrobiota bacterium]
MGPLHGADRPNILWLTCEDTGPELGCYGDAYAVTPHLDALARKGLRYRVCWSAAPVCAPARTTIISGVYPTSTGAEHMRSAVRLPSHMKLYPQMLREHGYYCSNNNKTDYNLAAAGSIWDDTSAKAHWKNRRAGQPFFAIFNSTVSHESQIRSRPHTLQHDPARVRVRAYHPDTPEVRHDWAQYYDKVTAMDAQAGRRLQELQQADLTRDTIVFFYGDHGSGMPRSKRWPYNSGLHVALIVYVPESFKTLAPKDYIAGGWSDRLVSFVDLAPTLLSLAGIQPPEWMQGHAIMGPFATPPPPCLHGFRGRMDERYDMVRSVRNSRYVYIRNYMPHLIYGQHINYMFQTPTTQVWKRLYDEGKLAPPQTAFWEPKPPEELYDLQNDPDEVNNLARSPSHQTVLADLRAALRAHALRIRDVGFLSEADMHRRSAASTPYDLGHDPDRYPLDRIIAMAELASMPATNDLDRLKAGLRDADSAVRYWAAMGLLIRSQPAVRASLAELRAALKDDSPTVRIVAARALGEHSSGPDLEKALAALKALAPPDANDAYVAMLALNAIDALGPKADGLREFIRTLPTHDPKAPARANSYVRRLVETIVK